MKNLGPCGVFLFLTCLSNVSAQQDRCVPGYNETDKGGSCKFGAADSADKSYLCDWTEQNGQNSLWKADYATLYMGDRYLVKPCISLDTSKLAFRQVVSLQSPLLCAAPSARFRVRFYFSMLSDSCHLSINITSISGETKRLWYTRFSTWQMEHGWDWTSRSFDSPLNPFRIVLSAERISATQTATVYIDFIALYMIAPPTTTTTTTTTTTPTTTTTTTSTTTATTISTTATPAITTTIPIIKTTEPVMTTTTTFKRTTAITTRRTTLAATIKPTIPATLTTNPSLKAVPSIQTTTAVKQGETSVETGSSSALQQPSALFLGLTLYELIAVVAAVVLLVALVIIVSLICTRRGRRRADDEVEPVSYELDHTEDTEKRLEPKAKTNGVHTPTLQNGHADAGISTDLEAVIV